MSKKTILITGGAGYIGSHANALLAEQGYETIILDNLVYGHREFVQWGSFVEGDILNGKLLDTIFTSRKVDAVMHFAAFAYVGESVTNPSKYYNNNVCGVLSLLDAMQRNKVDKLIFSSTCATYGNPQELPITETHPQTPINPYGMTKLVAEKAIADYGHAYGIRSVVLRYFNAAGADPLGRVGERHIPETHLIPLVLYAALDPKRAINIFGTDYDTPDGTCVRDYIHVADLAHAHSLALTHLMDGGASDVFNLGNGRGFSVHEVVQGARKVTGKNIAVRHAERRAGDPAYLVGSSNKIISELGWNPRFCELESILKSAWNWHQKDSSSLPK